MNYSLIERNPLPLDLSMGISDMGDRQAMGLPVFFVPSILESQVEHVYSQLIHLSKKELLYIVSSKSEPFLKRYVSGQILALVGDPRISIETPDMIDIPKWSGKLGLNINEVSKVTEEYKSLGIIKNWIEKESPEYYVEIKPFKMAKYPVTNKEYLAFLVDTKYPELPTNWKFGQYPHFLSNHPVYTLSDKAAISYCEWLSKKTNRKFRLPSESEWEYVAGGPEKLEFPWGNLFLADHSNTAESGIFQSTPVGIFPKGHSPFGCEDMGGNVEEYVADYYDGYNSTKPISDDLYEINGRYRVARGGSYSRFRDLTRCKRRHGYNPKEIYIIGFRLAEDY